MGGLRATDEIRLAWWIDDGNDVDDEVSDSAAACHCYLFYCLVMCYYRVPVILYLALFTLINDSIQKRLKGTPEARIQSKAHRS